METLLVKLKVPVELREAIISELPNVIEQIDEASKQIYDPNTIWLEAIQFADYVSQYALHLHDDHGFECVKDVAHLLLNLSDSFKSMAENALTVIDESEAMNGTQF